MSKMNRAARLHVFCDCCGPGLDRRGAMRLAFSGALAGAAGMAVPAQAARAATAVPAKPGAPATPAAALAALMDGNARFESTMKKPAACEVDLAALKAATAGGQAPFAAVLGCADSRVPPELVFDQTIGDIFVARVAGNIAGADVIASLEYGAAVLGTKAILVLAHSACGAVKATIAGKPVPGQISTLYRSIRPAVEKAGDDVEAVAKANALIQAGLLRETSPVLGEMVKQGKLGIEAGYYELATGKVTLLR
jgi:carbonic anhydrase